MAPGKLRLIFAFAVLPLASANNEAAVITGELVDVNGAKIAHAKVELRLGRKNARMKTGATDDRGIYRFSGLRAGEYTLKLSSPGFMPLAVRSIAVADGERKPVPPLELTVRPSGYSRVDFAIVVPSGGGAGGLGGSIVQQKGSPLAGATVALICGTSTICGVATTNKSGEFLFQSLQPGRFSGDVSCAGFYPRQDADFEVTAGRALIYRPMHLERCADRKCAPKPGSGSGVE